MLLNMAESAEQKSESNMLPRSHARVYNGLVNLVDAEGSFRQNMISAGIWRRLSRRSVGVPVSPACTGKPGIPVCSHMALERRCKIPLAASLVSTATK